MSQVHYHLPILALEPIDLFLAECFVFFLACTKCVTPPRDDSTLTPNCIASIHSNSRQCTGGDLPSRVDDAKENMQSRRDARLQMAVVVLCGKQVNADAINFVRAENDTASTIEKGMNELR
jgi:hypothetical protein